MTDDAPARVRHLARTHYGIELTAARAAELADELARLERGMREAPVATEFDCEPGSGFRQALLEQRGNETASDRERPAAAEAGESSASELAALSLVAAADGIAARRFSSLELTEACLDRIARAQPRLNCFISFDADAACERAKTFDETNAGATGSGGPLAGVPLAHKDMYYREGRISSCGSGIRRNVAADVTATVLARLDAAGALEIGTLNMSEFAAGATGHNLHFGDCENPWRPGYAPGGSSSGAGAAVAARLVYGALGSDTGGSIRLPAHFCGVVGLRPTYGRVSRFGAMARSWSADAVGPLTRTVRDAARLLGVIAGSDANDPTCENLAVPDYERSIENSLKGLRIGRPANFFDDNLDDERRGLLDASLEVMRGLGAEIVEIAVPDLAPAFTAAQIILKAEAAALHEEWLRARPDDYAPGVKSEMEVGLLIPGARYLAALRQRGAVLAEFADAVFDRVDVLHTPIYEYATPKLADCDPDAPGGAARMMATFGRCTRPFSYLGLPALAVPCGFTGDGMPLAMQLVGRPFAEATLLNAGHLYQRETDWHTRVPALASKG